MKKLYLISPYSHEDKKVREFRYLMAVKAAGELMNEGHIVFSPIVHCHPIAIEHNLPTDRQYWGSYDDAFIEWADEGHVLCLPGWSHSSGVAIDVMTLIRAGKPVYYNVVSLL